LTSAIAATASTSASADILAGPLRRPLVRLALPMLGAFLFQLGFNWVDTFFVARLGRDALAAVGSSMFVLWSMMALVELVSTGTLALVARSVGARRPDEAGAFALTGGTMALLLSAVVGLLSPLFVPEVVAVMGHTAQPAALAIEYLQTMFLGYPTLAVFYVLEGVFRGAGDTRSSMLVLTGCFVLNALLDWLLIFGVGPFPELGVRGAALATVIARGVGCIVLFAVLARRAGYLGVGRPSFAGLDLGRLLGILRIGAPASAAGLGFCAIYLVLVSITNDVGGPAAVAALGLGIRLEGLTYLTSVALGRAAGTMAGQNLGAGNPDRARAAARAAIRTGLLVMLPLSVAMLAVPEPVIRLFIDDPDVVAAGAAYLRIVAVALFPMVFEVVLNNVASGVGDTLPAMAVNLGGTALRIPIALGLAALGHGHLAVWYAIGATMVIKGAAFEVWFRRGRWARGVQRPDGSRA
jgi:putative MATE family efflux protein